MYQIGYRSRYENSGFKDSMNVFGKMHNVATPLPDFLRIKVVFHENVIYANTGDYNY